MGSQVGSFSLKVRREIGKPAPAPKPVAAGPPVLGKAMVESIPAESVPAAPKPTKVTKLSVASSRPISNFSLMKDAADAGILFITSPKVLSKSCPTFSTATYACDPYMSTEYITSSSIGILSFFISSPLRQNICPINLLKLTQLCFATPPFPSALTIFL